MLILNMQSAVYWHQKIQNNTLRLLFALKETESNQITQFNSKN